ncbi:MAG: hypothetical protein GXX85_13655, partial [Ignavibacteria bacterium]|nr:hypothetical protein [Ignavibacteria bacterium]
MKISLIILVIFFLVSRNYSQSFWELPNVDRHLLLSAFDYDTTKTNLKKIILNRRIDPYRYFDALVILAQKYKETEKDFILSSLYTENSDSLDGAEKARRLYKEKYLYDNIIKGYYGLPEAVDNLIAFANDNSYVAYPACENKMNAVLFLAKGGIYNNFDALKDEYINNYCSVSRHLISNYYGKKLEFRQEILTVIEGKIRENLNDWNNTIPYIVDIEIIGCDAVTGVLDKMLTENMSSESRSGLLRELEKCDMLNQPERIMKVIPIENDPEYRCRYYPYLPFIFNGEAAPADNDKYRDMRGYVMPKFINFLKERILVEESQSCREDAEYFIKKFKPFKPDSTHLLQYLMDDFQNYLEEVNNYGWINENTKYAEYKTQLEYAETNIA